MSLTHPTSGTSFFSGADYCPRSTHAARTTALFVVAAVVTGSGIVARVVPEPNAADAIAMFLERPDPTAAYRAARRLEATGSGQQAWLDAETEFTPEEGLHYEITGQGGSGLLLSRVLRALLEEERQLIARGGSAGVALSAANYRFTPTIVAGDGLAHVTMEPRRKERSLIAGTLLLDPADGELVRVEGRLVRNPSLWISRVEIVRHYRRINGALVPVSLDSTAQLRLLGRSTLHMTYTYSALNGLPVIANP